MVKTCLALAMYSLQAETLIKMVVFTYFSNFESKNKTNQIMFSNILLKYFANNKNLAKNHFFILNSFYKTKTILKFDI